RGSPSLARPGPERARPGLTHARSPMSPLTQAPPQSTSAAPVLTWAALAVAVVGSVGSVYLSVGMGLKACPLCFYQRSFMMGVVGVLGVGLLAGVRPAAPLSLLWP